MRSRLWILYPSGAVLATAVYYLLGHNSYLFNAIGLASPILILAAIHIHRPSARAPWLLIAIGQFLFIAGDVFSYNYEKFHARIPAIFPLDFAFNPAGDVPFPSVADACYLLVYPFLTAGVLLLIRSRKSGRDRTSLLDSLMVAIGVGAVTWVMLISPYTQITDLDIKTQLTAMAYPIMDLLLITAGIRLAVGAGRRPPAFYLMMSAILALFVTDAIYGWFGLYTAAGYQPGSGWLEAGWMGFYVLLGTCALHPSMRILTEPAEEAEQKLTTSRLAVLAGASLVAPTVMAIQIGRNATDNSAFDMPVLVTATIFLFILVVIRMWGLVRHQEDSALREKALREAGAALVTATNRESIYAAALDAARSLAGESAVIRVCAAHEGSDELTVVAAVGGGETIGSVFPFASLEAWKQDALMHRRTYSVDRSESRIAQELAIPEGEGGVFTAPLFVQDELKGVLVLATEGSTTALSSGLDALASQVSLAVESAALTEEILTAQSEKRFASLVQNASDIVTVLEPDTTIRYASPASLRVLGYEPQELEGTRFANLIGPEDKTKVLSFLTSVGEDGHTGLVEFRARHKDGRWVFVETLRTSLLHDENVRGIVLNTRDITERKEFEEQLSHQAFHDSITNLANRALFRDRVTHAMERQERDHRPVAVLFMDLDDFKTINDSLGHAAGDQLLGEVGERLKTALRAADTAARLGGDEFAILLEEGGEGLQPVEVADRIMAALAAPFTLEGKEVFVTASIGIAVADDAGQGPDDPVEGILRNADVAMYMAKENGKGRYQVFEPAMHETALKRLELKADLQRAVEHDEFVLHYQPVVELESGRISGVEALIRWMHPERGMVPPLDFIPLAEETGLIVEIGRWVLQEACTYGKALQQRYPSDPPFHMAVNLSARQLQRPEVVEEIRGMLEETGLEPSSLILEITESVMMSNMEMSIERLGELKALGVLLAVDDFGTGYSSLNYIQQFPVDILKVDKSFVDVVNSDSRKSALTATILKLAQDLDLKPVAEGIERADQLERLLELHCDLGQGFFFAKPLNPEALQGLLSERRSMHAEADALATGPTL